MTVRSPESSLSTDRVQLAQRIDAALPQTQCTRCGYPDCAAYALAIASGDAAINQCPPGGADGVQRLSVITGKPALPLRAEHGVEGPRAVAFVDESWCIGCTLCIKACPTDAIVGASKRMHTVIEAYCTGCELCVPVCPVDCIALENASGANTGWAAWSAPQADMARTRYRQRRDRIPLPDPPDGTNVTVGAGPRCADGAAPSAAVVCTDPTARGSGDHTPTDDAAAMRRAAIAAALERARQRRTPGTR